MFCVQMTGKLTIHGKMTNTPELCIQIYELKVKKNRAKLMVSPLNYQIIFLITSESQSFTYSHKWLCDWQFLDIKFGLHYAFCFC